MPDVDMLIVGGGIAGASLAARLAGSRRVALLEAESHAGFHATGRSAAVFVPNYADAVIRELSAMSRPFFDAPDPELFDVPLLSRRGLLRLVAPDGLGIYEEAMHDAPGIEPVTLDEARKMFPVLDPSRFVQASIERDVHDIDVHALLQGWLRAARTAGSEIRFGAAVMKLERAGDAWIVDTASGRLRAPVLVNAAGGWADCLAVMAGIEPIGLRPCRRSVAVLPLPDALAGEPRPPFVVPFPLRWFAKVEAARLLVSTAEEDVTDPHDVFADDMTLAQGLHRFEEDVTMKVERVTGSWAGMRTFSADGYPAIGFDPLAPGFFWLAGQGGFGIQTAPALAALAAMAIDGGDAKTPSGRTFDVSRFRDVTKGNGV